MDEPVFVLAPESPASAIRPLRARPSAVESQLAQPEVPVGLHEPWDRSVSPSAANDEAPSTLRRENFGFSSLRYVSLRLLWDCNLRCIMCDHPHRPRSEMPVEMAHKILDQLTHPVRLTFIGGEPCLWLLKHPEILRRTFADGHLVNMVTNGILLPRLPDFVNAFRDKPVSVHLSIDGYGATYERIRKRSSWDALVNSLRLLQTRRMEGGNRQAVICANYLLMRSTLEDLPTFVRFCAREGIDSIFFIYAYIDGTMVRLGEITEDESVYHLKEETNEAMRQAALIAQDVGVSLACPPPLGDSSVSGLQWIGPMRATTAPGKSIVPNGGRVPCEKPFKEIYIYQDGTVRPCCCGSQGPAIGNVNDGLEAVWNGERMEAVRNLMASNRMPEECRCGINISSVARRTSAEHFFIKSDKLEKAADARTR